jgi:hypothetical protein
MPCDTRIKTSVVDLAKADRKRLAAVLEADGWVLYENTASLLLAGKEPVGQGLALGLGRGARPALAVPAGALLTIDGSGATLATTTKDQGDELHASIRRAYAARTLKDVSARFGFKVTGSEQLLGGAQRVMLRR